MRLAPDEGVTGHEFEPTMKSILDRSNITSDSPGAGVSNPITLPDDVGVEEFVSLLDIVFGK